jgi:DUF4097 and DUF4098 domain-containing protein YvlB
MFRTVALAAFTALAIGSSQSGRVSLEAADCSSLNMMFGDFEVGRAEQYATVPVSAGTLELRPDFNGGVKIEKGSGAVYGITACIAAGARTQGEAQAAANEVRLSIQGSRVRITGGSSRNWSAHLVVTAPDGASIDAETSNGPLGVSGVSGTFSLRASNGPISLRDVTGKITARASNGPIDVVGSRGEFDVETSNGPITVRLDGQRWDGRLTGRAQNGPLTVAVPAGYQSGVEISSSFHSPWSCQVDACRNGNRDWDERSRSLKIGSDPVVVKLTTVNGPVTVRER